MTISDATLLILLLVLVYRLGELSECFPSLNPPRGANVVSFLISSRNRLSGHKSTRAILPLSLLSAGHCKLMRA